MKDRFSEASAAYARYRPDYPAALFTFINSFVNEKELAWDCGTGNGQTAVVLSNYYKQVCATDISGSQLSQAPVVENINYLQASANQVPLAENCVDLVTVSQALHWFDFSTFYQEVKRVGKPAAIIAVWTYSLLHISEEIDSLISNFHFNTLHDYWDPERKWVNEGYQTIPFPFQTIDTPPFYIEVDWNKEQLAGYIKTWSAVKKYISDKKQDPVETLMGQILSHWKEGTIKKAVFPLHLKMGYIHS